jgi:hypothetical protein
MFFGPAANSLFASGRCSNMWRRMRERCFDTVAADRAASDQRNGDPVERLGDARQSISVYGGSEKQFGQLSYLERERSRGRRSADRNDHDFRCLYGTGDLPIGQPDDNGDQPRGRQQIRIGNCHRAERRFYRAALRGWRGGGARRTWRYTRVLGRSAAARIQTSPSFGAYPVRRVVRISGCQRQLRSMVCRPLEVSEIAA